METEFVNPRAGWPTILLLAAAAGAGALGYSLWDARDNAPSIGSMVSGFQRMNELTVFRAQVVAVPTSRIDGIVDLLDREQTAIIPAQVRYTVDLSKMTPTDVVWNASGDTVTLTVPPVLIQRPDLTEERARFYSNGVLTRPATQDELRRSNSIKAVREAFGLARNPELVRMAQASARDAISANALLLLRGRDGKIPKVVVRFANEGRRSSEQWERSRSLEDVAANRF